MENLDLTNYLTEQDLVLIPVLYIVGSMLKNSNNVKDWTIPWILLILGIVLSIAICGLNVQTAIQGIIATGITVFGNHLIKQTTIKNKEDREQD